MAKWALNEFKDMKLVIAIIDNDIRGSHLPQMADVDSNLYKRNILNLSKNEINNIVKACRILLLFGEVKR